MFICITQDESLTYIYIVDKVKKNWGKQRFYYQSLNDWNTLPLDLRNSETLAIFKANLKSFIILN